jgi:acyl CoA:acetate/3-ketoacid CoA transferase alpha subunit/acyl CoA:acetate/3-ketoacid CoA transferase beta subunit
MGLPFLAEDVDSLVLRFVRPGMHLHFAATMSRPNALLNAVCRVFEGTGRLTASTTAVHSNAHAMALSGAVSHVVTCFLGDTCPTPRPNRLYTDVARGKPFTVETWSLLSYLQRLTAGATGLPYAVTASLVDSDLAENLSGRDLFVVPDPVAPERSVALLRPMRPDLTLVHGVCADRRGNVVLCAPLGEGPWAAYAAEEGVLASVERIVPDEVVDAVPDRVVVPARSVRGLCEARWGAHPQSLRTAGLADVPGYLDDYAFLEEIVRFCAEGRGQEWYSTWVREPEGHEGYLRALGSPRIEALLIGPTASRGRPSAASSGQAPPAGSEGTGAASAAPTAPDARRGGMTETSPTGTRTGSGCHTSQERLIVLAARAVADLVRSGGHDTLLAGIGVSHMAAWLAAEVLHDEGGRVHVAAELGFLGMTPSAGDVYLFSQRHAAGTEQLCGIQEVLGAHVGGNPRCLGVLAAAEVDRRGNVNTTILPDGRWVTGSGGANDIASSCDCVVVVPASRRRCVRRVAHVTSPGRRVLEIVSPFGRFRRRAPHEEFGLATWYPPDGEESVGPRRTVLARTLWDPDIGPDPIDEEEITAVELEKLRGLDPEGHYR